jgi:hypothetical protein
MRIWIIILSAILGIIICAWSRWETSDIRWNPLYGQQLPQPHSTATFEFWSDSGDFEIAVKLPIPISNIGATIEPVKKPPMPCQLTLRVSRGKDLVTTANVDSLKWSGIVGSTHMDCFNGGMIALPKLGKYVIEINNGGEEFKTPGARFSLERSENAENVAVLYGISTIVGCALIGVSTLMIIFSAIRYFDK